jgi:hypothetical protein
MPCACRPLLDGQFTAEFNHHLTPPRFDLLVEPGHPVRPVKPTAIKAGRECAGPCDTADAATVPATCGRVPADWHQLSLPPISPALRT